MTTLWITRGLPASGENYLGPAGRWRKASEGAFQVSGTGVHTLIVEAKHG